MFGNLKNGNNLFQNGGKGNEPHTSERFMWELNYSVI